MAVFYTQNFDSTSVGTLPAGWTAIGGTSWAVENSLFVSSPNALGCSSPDGSKLVFVQTGGELPLADMEVLVDIKVGAAGSFMGVGLRLDSAFQNGYLIIPNDPTNLNGNWNVYKAVGGSFTSINTSVVSGLSGGTYTIRARIQGNVITGKIWNTGSAEPGSNQIGLTDGSITAAGYPGFYNQGSTPTACADNFSVNDLQNASISVSPSSVVTSSAGNSLTLTGTGTSWTAGTPGTPTFTVSAGTITAQTVTNGTHATLTYTAPGTAQTVTITDPSTGATTTLTVNTAATDFTLTPASLSTTAGNATGNYTITPNGTPSSTASIALSDSAAGGTFAPPGPLTFNSSAPQTFTYTPSNGASPGTLTLHATASGGLTTSHTASCVVTSGPTTISCTDAAFTYSPGSFDHLVPPTFGVAVDTMQAICPGASIKFAVTSTATLVVNVDTSTLTGLAVPSVMRASINTGAWIDTNLTNQTQVTLATGLDPGTVYEVELYLVSTSSVDGTRWGSVGTSPTDVWRFKGIQIDTAGTIQTYAYLRPKKALVYGDSITEGQHILASGGSDATYAFGNHTTLAFDAELGNIGYGGQGFQVAGNLDTPAFSQTWNFISAGRSRTMTGYDYIFIVQGSNDGRAGVSDANIISDITTLLPLMRAATGSSTIIFVCTPPYGGYVSAMDTAVAAYKTSSGDANTYRVNAFSYLPAGAFTISFSPGIPTEYTYEGVHPNIYGSARYGATLGGAGKNVLGGGSTTAGYSRSRVVNS